MAKLIPFSGTVAQLYQSYGQKCFVGQFYYTAAGLGVAGYASSASSFNAGGSGYTDVGGVSLNGFVIV